MKQQLLSVIIPVYNVRSYLQECVDSVLGQTYRNMELILVDDGSDDGSEILCDEIARCDSRVIVIHQCNSGQSAARNAALNICKGEYLSFIDSDDSIYPCNLYESLIVQLDKAGSDFAQFPFLKEGRLFNNQTDRIISDKIEMYNLWINGKTITNYMWDKIWRRTLFKSLRFKDGMIFEDRYIFVDLLNKCSSVILTTHGEYFYRTHPGQTTLRKRDSFFLKSMLAADLHILDMMPRKVNKLRSFVEVRMFSTFVELDALKSDKAIANDVADRLSWPSIISIRMFILKLLGYNAYRKILG